MLCNYSVDDGVPRSNPNRFSKEIGLLIAKQTFKAQIEPTQNCAIASTDKTKTKLEF